MNPTKISLLDRAFTAYARSVQHRGKDRLIRSFARLLSKEKIRAWCKFAWFNLNPQDYLQSHLLYGRAFEARSLSNVSAFLREGDVFLDIGANVGLYSLLAASRHARVLAVEPNPSICAELLENIHLNACGDRVKVANVAAGDAQDIIHIGIPEQRNRGMSREVDPSRVSGAVCVATMRIAAVCRALGMTDIRLVKIDVEGAELHALRGLLEGPDALRPQAILFEYLPEHFSYGDAPHALIRYLNSHGYAVKTIDGNEYVLNAPIDECNLWAELREQES